MNILPRNSAQLVCHDHFLLLFFVYYGERLIKRWDIYCQGAVVVGVVGVVYIVLIFCSFIFNLAFVSYFLLKKKKKNSIVRFAFVFFSCLVFSFLLSRVLFLIGIGMAS